MSFSCLPHLQVYVFLKTVGADPVGHPVMHQISRIQKKFDRISQVAKRLGSSFFLY